MMEQSNLHRRLDGVALNRNREAAGQCAQATDNGARAIGGAMLGDKAQSSAARDGRVGPMALHLAAQAWCQPGVTHKVMDPDLCCAFAAILERELSKPWLGNATTAQLLDEVHARCGSLQYATARG